MAGSGDAPAPRKHEHEQQQPQQQQQQQQQHKPLTIMQQEIEALESALRDSEARNASLEALALSLMAEAEKAEMRRSRERRLRRASTSGTALPAATVEQVRDMLEEGAAAMLAAQEHTQALVEMRLAAMGEQLARCESALPSNATTAALRASSPTQPVAAPEFVALAKSGRGFYDSDEDWAEPTTGGLCLESLPLHVPSVGASNGVTGGAFGIHGRRPAIATVPWSNNPARVAEAWWSEAASQRSNDEGGDDSTPPSPGNGPDEQVAAAATIAGDVEPSMMTTPRRSSLAASDGIATGGLASSCGSTLTATPRRFPPQTEASRPAVALPGWENGDGAGEVRAPEAQAHACPAHAHHSSPPYGIACTCWRLDRAQTPFMDAPFVSPAREDSSTTPRSLASPWALVTQTLSEALTPRPRGRQAAKSRSRLSVAGQQALSGALQVAVARHPILASISPDLRRDFAASCMRELKVRAGAVVAAQGADCDAFAVVGSGIFDGALLLERASCSKPL